MHISILQHTPDEGPGAITVWAHAHGHEVTIYHPYQFGILPRAEDVDLLVMLGGPMSPNDELPWIKQERNLIQQMLTANKPMFGACFGAQQIGKTLGAVVSKAEAKEVGWAPVFRQSTAIPGLPQVLIPLHWHEEQVEVPAGAERLFSSDLVRNQGFVIGRKIVGLQFHLETLAEGVRSMVANDRQYVQNSALGQTPQQILDHGVPAANQAAINLLLDYITA